MRLAAGREGAGHGEEDDFLVGPGAGGVVFLGATAGCGVGVGDGGPSVVLGVRGVFGCLEGCVRGDVYSNFTPSGSLSPTLRGAILVMSWIGMGV